MIHNARKALVEVTIKLTVEARIPYKFPRVNRHGSTRVTLIVSYYEGDRTNTKDYNCTFGLRKDLEEINWYFPDTCPKEVAYKVTNMYTYQELADYIERLPHIEKVSKL